MESRVINRIRRHLLSLAIFSHGKSCNKSYYKTSIVMAIFNGVIYRRHLLLLDIFSHESLLSLAIMEIVLEDIYCCWLYFPMESHVINRIRRHLLSLAIFYHGKSCNKSY